MENMVADPWPPVLVAAAMYEAVTWASATIIIETRVDTTIRVLPISGALRHRRPPRRPKSSENRNFTRMATRMGRKDPNLGKEIDREIGDAPVLEIDTRERGHGHEAPGGQGRATGWIVGAHGLETGGTGGTIGDEMGPTEWTGAEEEEVAEPGVAEPGVEEPGAGTGGEAAGWTIGGRREMSTEKTWRSS